MNARPLDAIRSTRLRGFSLAELLVAMTIVSLLMAGIGSAVLIATHALPSRTGAQATRMDAAALLDQIESELAYAVTVPERTATAIAFAVPDRDGNGNAERIRYSYSAAAKTISREYSGSTAQAMLTGVESLAFEYVYVPVAVSYDGLPVEDTTATLLSSNGSLGGRLDVALSDSHWVGQLIAPSMPGDAVSWRITDATVFAERMRTSGANVRARVHAAKSSGLPRSHVLEDQSLSDGLLSAIGSLPAISLAMPYGVAFTGAHALDPDENACLVIAQLSGASGTLEFSCADGSGLLTGNSSNWNWTLDAAHGMHHSCYGRFTRRGAATGFNRQYVCRVRTTIRTSSESADRSADVLLLNKPEALTRQLHLDFLSNPTTIDVDGDAAHDWALISGVESDIEIAGMLTKSVVFGTSPDTPINANAIVELKFRATQVDGDGDALRIVTEPDNGFGNVVIVSATLNTDGTQTLQFLSEDRATLFRVNDLPGDLIEVLMIFDAAIDGLNVSVNGSRGETRALSRGEVKRAGPAIQVGRLGSPVEIDDVCIHIY